MLKKAIIVITAIAVATSGLGTVFAVADNGDSLDYTFISSVITNLAINASGKASCSATIYCYPGTDSVRISAYLQRNVSGSWVTVQHWSESSSGNYGSMYKEYYVTSGYQYRLYVYYYAYEGDDVESTVGVDYYTY